MGELFLGLPYLFGISLISGALSRGYLSVDGNRSVQSFQLLLQSAPTSKGILVGLMVLSLARIAIPRDSARRSAGFGDNLRTQDSNHGKKLLGLMSVGWKFAICLVSIWLMVGCGTTTQRTATEQLLMSDAIDQSISKLDFSPLSGRKIYLDTTYLRPIPGYGFVNADYVISSLRQHLTAARCMIQEDRQQAEIIVEARLGTLATNGHDMIYGLPSTNNLAQAAASISGATLLPPLPEISIARSTSNSGHSKLAMFAYDRETRQPIWQSGIARSESTAQNTWVMGAGPFTKGSIYEGKRFAGTTLDKKAKHGATANLVPYAAEHIFVNPDVHHGLRQADQRGASQNITDR